MTRLSSVSGNVGENGVVCGVFDSTKQFGFFGHVTTPAIAVKYDLSSMTRIGAISGIAGENRFRSACAANNIAYFGSDTSPARVVAVDLNSFTRLGAVTANPEEISFHAAVCDATNKLGYWELTRLKVSSSSLG